MLLAGMGSFSQAINLSDSLYRVLRHKPSFTAKLDSRNSLISGNKVSTLGIKAGLSFNNQLTIGIGYNWLSDKFYHTALVNGELRELRLRFRYIAPFIEYTFYRKGNWEATIPLQIGIGRSFLQSDKVKNKYMTHRGSFVVYEPVMTVEYKFFNLIGVGGGLGYRIMLKNNRQIDQHFGSPVFVLKIRLIFGEAFRRGRAAVNREIEERKDK
jgi:hypothetical protein